MITVKEINPVDAESWLAEFQQSKLFHRIRGDYRHVISNYREMTVLRAALNHTVYAKPRDFCQQFGILDVIPYYYIQRVMEIDPDQVIDLGCGLNVFKQTWPNIVGIDADPDSNYDIMDHFDQDFALGHQQYCDALISINTIHFAPIDQITQRLQWCADLLKPGGRAFVSFNLETWLMYSNAADIFQLFGVGPQLADIVNYVDHAIKSAELDLMVYDWPVLRVAPESSIRDDLNGNIRLVFQR